MNKRPVYFMQTDARWKSKPYRATGETSTVGSAGCGPTCAAMVIQSMTGKGFTPLDACNWSMEHGYKALKQGTYYAYFQAQFKAFGIPCTQLNYDNLYGKADSSVHKQALELLQDGWYLIACMGKGTWTKSGHFVLVWWADGMIHINDPNSKEPARMNGNKKDFLSQVKYYWAIDARKHNQNALDEAVDRLVKAGIITGAAYWKQGNYNNEYVKFLLQKVTMFCE